MVKSRIYYFLGAIGQRIPLPIDFFVCLFVCKITQKLWMDLDEIFRKGQQWSTVEVINFWERSESEYFCQ